MVITDNYNENNRLFHDGGGGGGVVRGNGGGGGGGGGARHWRTYTCTVHHVLKVKA